jgi:hypothetical protein
MLLVKVIMVEAGMLALNPNYGGAVVVAVLVLVPMGWKNGKPTGGQWW